MVSCYISEEGKPCDSKDLINVKRLKKRIERISCTPSFRLIVCVSWVQLELKCILQVFTIQLW